MMHCGTEGGISLCTNPMGISPVTLWPFPQLRIIGLAYWHDTHKSTQTWRISFRSLLLSVMSAQIVILHAPWNEINIFDFLSQFAHIVSFNIASHMLHIAAYVTLGRSISFCFKCFIVPQTLTIQALNQSFALFRRTQPVRFRKYVKVIKQYSIECFSGNVQSNWFNKSWNATDMFCPVWNSWPSALQYTISYRQM